MQRVFRVMTPGWLISFIAVALFVYTCFTLLAPWQLGKNEDLKTRNSQLLHSVEADPVPLTELTARDAPLDESEWHRVTVTGRYLPEDEVLLRQQAVDGEQVYQVLTAFRTEGGDDLLINRGWVRVGENNTVPTYPAAVADPVTITARLRMPTDTPAEPIVLHDRHMVRSIETSTIGRVLDLDLAGYHLQLPGGQPGSLEPTPIPEVEAGSYLSYGLQWLAFGVLAPIGLGYFLWSEIRERRRQRSQGNDEQGSLGDGAVGPGDRDIDPDVVSGHIAEVDAATEAVAHDRLVTMTVRDRYGTRFEAERRRRLRPRNRLDY
ncbi:MULTISPECIES: SURF1 family cytochrome oxidase biogenesis protein [Dietzia]|uniref:SURF1-like protein n=2 Tax=Dietzia TaxID=37914 RepID=A0A365P7H2_9ACTN|nr:MULTISPECIES: SURF1 family cytochrome oxidase biogenesis protein [Dietzia]MBB1011900.1 hypothetical protein [Dietzia kunjamensis]MBB1014472.1 hypothetical protein [Dietzia kunjamensis subsp. schimae]MBB1017751.1 hypothetical protein [Dietzia sp. DQ11-71]MBB1020548.1 hypothetical protein [Dietzia sp. E1]MBB1041400.1 hypothetical protein [Dietzia sp. Cai40]MBB1046192.1 hypothetical protein [Dietzia sp. DQ11-44]MBB1055588.1 hypothetical protein [Dietzia sp. B44]MBB1058922.1 hypothetical pro